MVRYIAESEEDFKTIQEPPPVAYLTLIVGGRMSHSFPLRSEVNMGREKSNAIVVADQKVSRYHASLTPIDDTFIISDRGSANGTYVNGVLIAQPTRLKNNDRISVGDAAFLFTTHPPDPEASDHAVSPPPPSPPPASPSSSSLTSKITNSNVSVWVLIGCMILIIIALLFFVAVLLGLFIGRTQIPGMMILGLAQINGLF
ncbi:MAG: FHA domain-containing protein [Anaerolineae bacterium]|nr:FHA domain-containing protein [Anaerolineae bacterium]